MDINLKVHEIENYFIIGDVHGCYNTLKRLLKSWNKEKEMLIQLGDMIDRGNYSPETVRLFRKLKERYPDRVIVLIGNHEYEAIKYLEDGKNQNWMLQTGIATLEQYKAAKADFKKDVEWFKLLPLKYETKYILVSHAGIAKAVFDPYTLDATNGILWNRSELKNIGKVQIIGHTPYTEGYIKNIEEANAWNIDTGAYLGGHLTALRVDLKGKVMEVVRVKTLDDDIK